MTSRDLAKRIDHTLLKADASHADIERLCQEATEWQFAAVCVNPRWVRMCADSLRGTAVAVCTVAGFPLGANGLASKVFECEHAVGEGATEIDVVIDIGALKSGDQASVAEEIAAVVTAACRGSALTKVIIEAALLTDDEKRVACVMARDAGAAFVKTSTGFGPHGATVSDVMLMREAVGPAMGVKASGGIRDRAAAEQFVQAGATRLGTSAGVAIVRGDVRRRM